MRSRHLFLICLLGIASGDLSNQLVGQTAKTSFDDGATAAPAAVKVEAPANEYVIGPDDVLAVNVWKEPEISRTLPVRATRWVSFCRSPQFSKRIVRSAFL